MKASKTLFLISVMLLIASLLLAQAPATQQPAGGQKDAPARGGRGAGGGGQRGAPATPAATPVPSVFIEELTFYEVRDAIAGGNTVGIVPTGGTEKNGFHMTMGKHNFHVRKGAEMMAKKLGNALIAPVIQYVPEGQASEETPGVLSCPGACFEHIVEAAARSLKTGGFKEILLIGDNGGNQNSLKNVADKLSKEWEGSDTKIYGLTDFYEKGHEYLEAWLLAQFGWDAQVVGSHAGIQDTSQMLYVKPEDVRKNRIADSFNNRQESSVSGDPTKATEEFGRIALEFKSNAAIAQYRALKAPPRGGRGGRGGE
jgi:creatinine amidohydrolase/Fe(II)-dependent formamide hydrolase-like protein